MVNVPDAVNGKVIITVEVDDNENKLLIMRAALKELREKMMEMRRERMNRLNVPKA